jgi:hypothetical protein
MRNDRLRSGTGPLPHSCTQLLRKIILGTAVPAPGFELGKNEIQRTGYP